MEQGEPREQRDQINAVCRMASAAILANVDALVPNYKTRGLLRHHVLDHIELLERRVKEIVASGGNDGSHGNQ